MLVAPNTKEAHSKQIKEKFNSIPQYKFGVHSLAVWHFHIKSPTPKRTRNKLSTHHMSHYANE